MTQPMRESSTYPQVECPSCGSKKVSSSTEVEHFKYGDKESEVTLAAQVSVHLCAECGSKFTLEDASELRHEAVCRHLGILTPTEVRAVRERYALSQAEFSEISKIGKASLARWENGLLFQTLANDNLLYLLTFEDNFVRLKDKVLVLRSTPSPNLAENVIPFKPKFRAISKGEMERLEREAKAFDLFPVELVG